MITSKDNGLMKLCNQVKNKKYSRENKLCLIETIKVVSELYLKDLVTHIFVTQEKYDLVKNYTKAKIEVISDSLINYISDSSSSDGVFALCKIPDNTDINYSKCIVLDNIQDPANIGAIIRSACAFGFKTILAVNSVYPYSYKCIRSSMGYIFDVNYIETTYNDLNHIKNDNNILFISADMDGEIVDTKMDLKNNIALVIGNEGQGISRNIEQLSDKKVAIAMDNGVESLNASVSAGILMYLLK